MNATVFDKQIAQDLIAFSPDGLCATDLDLKYVAWNAAMTRITGIPAEVAVGKGVFELFPFLENVGEREVAQRVMRGESVVIDPRPYNIPESGRVGFFQGHYWPWRNSEGEIIGCFVGIRDVGASFNRLLFLSELSSALSKAVTPQETLDITLDFLRRSTGAERGLAIMLVDGGKTIEVVARNNADAFIRERERLAIDFEIPLTRAMAKNKVVFSPDEVDAQNYSYRHQEYVKATGDVAAAAVPLMVEGEIIGGIAVSYKKAQKFTDEDASYWTAAANLCAQCYSRAIQFEKERAARAAAEAANKAKGRFLANVSHELRTPLTVVIGQAELMKNAIERAKSELSEEIASKFKKYSERCFDQGVMLARILEDILDLTKIESGSITLRKESIEVNDWLEDIAAVAVQLTSNKPIEVKLFRASSTPQFIANDNVRAKQVVLNLVSNASKFTDAGEIIIDACGETDELGRQILVIKVKDTGTGIEESRKTAIFGAFEKSRMSKHERGGHGLGLAIATQLASTLGGSLSLVESAETKGSTFQLKLPDLGLEKQQSQNPARDHIASQTLNGTVVLLAEDDPIILDYLTDLLKSAGATVVQAHDGSEAIEYALEEKPDVIVLDIQMPVIDGFQAAQQLSESLPDIPLIALTAHGLPEYKKLAQQCGFSKFLIKPVDLGTLADTILSLRAQIK